jgi:shikimate kinase
MGSGKTTIGQIIANTLGAPFRDTDLIIEAKAGKSVADIFLENGEDEFRILEREVLREELLSDGAILALGGGACISPDAQSALRACGSHIVFLDVSLTTVAPRIGFNRDRPLLLSNPRGQWLSIMEARRPIYESIAKSVIDTNDRSAESIAAEIVKDVA